MSTRRLIEQFDAWQQESDALVLITVVATEGSTYSKTGRQLLMRADGSHAGLISGGCLEGDLANHAAEVIKDGAAKLITYDMRDDADDLWGIGLGCNGLMRLLVQRINKASGWQPFNNIKTALGDQTPHEITLVTASPAGQLPVGACLIDGTPVDSAALTGQETLCKWLTTPWVRLLILGATPDAEPVASLARTTGWEVTVADHREHYLSKNNFSSADKLILTEPDRLNEQLDLSAFDAIVVMSHHLETDRKYLQHLGDATAAYIGLLGPAKRKQKLLEDLPGASKILGERLHGPVGLDIGSDSPETIALALIAEIQSLRNAKQP
jgi:xanthine dehydrogenase accessory factor